MSISGIRLDSFGSPLLNSSVTVEALPVEGKVPELLPAQRLTATVLELNGRQALIDLNGTKVALAAFPGIRLGAELSIQVAQVAPRLLLEIVPRPTKTPTQLLSLAIGQEIEAEVVGQLPSGSVVLNIEGARLEAEAPENFPLGKTFAARVEQLRPQVVLHVLPDAEELAEFNPVQNLQTEATRLLRTTISNRTVSADSFNTLSQELAAFVEHPSQEAVPPSITKLHMLLKTLLPEHVPPTAEQLAAFVRDGGLHYEAKLLQLAESTPQKFSQAAEKDLKGLLLQALRDLTEGLEKTELAEPGFAETQASIRKQEHETTVTLLTKISPDKAFALPPPPPQDITVSLVHHLEYIESQQAVNLLAQTKGEPYQLQIPLFTGQGMTTAFLSIESEGRGNKETGKPANGETGQAYNILFMLDLDGFGQTRIEARVGKKSLWVAFYVDQHDSVALLQRELVEFREIIRSLGYEEVLLTAKPLGRLAPEKREQFDALEAGVPASVHLLDVKA